MKRFGLVLALATQFVGGLLAGCGGTSGSVGGSTGGGGGSQPPPPTLVITTPSLPLGLAGTPYSAQLTAANGNGTLTWSAAAALPSVMPSGLHLSSSGLLSGTPTTFSCGPSLTVNVADSSTPPQTGSATFLPNIAGFIAGLHSGQVGVFYNDAIQFECSAEPISWSLVSGTLPPGLQMQPYPGVTSQLNFPGTPTTAGTYSFVVQATDSSGRIAQQSSSVSILPPALVLTDTAMQVGTVNLSFDHSPVTTGGTPPYTFTISSGKLAPGLTVNAATGDISGKPTTAALYTFNLQATDSTTPSHFSVNKAYTLLVTPAPLPPRNDTMATATPIFPGVYTVSLSPYTDSAGNAAPDQDYYSLTVNGGEQYDIGAISEYGVLVAPTDPALEILDSTGARIGTCNDPIADGATASDPYSKGGANFTDPCVDHGGDGITGQSRLVLKIRPGAAETIYIHVFDFQGRARPDFIYTLGVTKD